MRMSARTSAFCPPWLSRSFAAEQWWELEQRLNDLLELNPYGEEPDERWSGMHTAIREGLLHVDPDPQAILNWLGDRDGEGLVLSLASEPGRLTRKTFDAYPQTRVIRRLRTLLDQWGVLALTEDQLALPLVKLIEKLTCRQVKAAIARRKAGVSLPETCLRHPRSRPGETKNSNGSSIGPPPA